MVNSGIVSNHHKRQKKVKLRREKEGEILKTLKLLFEQIYW